MKRKIIEAVKALLGFRKSLPPPKLEKEVAFVLAYGDLIVGTLSAQGGVWKFEYSEEFKLQDDIRPILELPDVNKIYESPELWQFFEMRIPSMEQPEIKKVLDEENIDEEDSIALLERFGRRTIANPFSLESKKSRRKTRHASALT